MKVFITSALLAVFLTANTVTGTPLTGRDTYSVKDSHHVPQQWARVGPAPAQHVINLNIGLKQSQFDKLEKQLYQVSDPDHPSYGKHLTSAQVNELIKPYNETLDQVHEWLKEYNIDTSSLTYTPAKDWIKVNLPVSAIERLLDTKYSVYKHEDGTHLVRAPEWSLPAHLHKHIDTIQPTNTFFRPDAHARTFKTIKPFAEFGEDGMNGKSVAYVEPRKNLTVAEACDTAAVSITCLRTLYGTIDYVPQSVGLTTVAITNYLNETANRSDAALFLQTFRPEAIQYAELFQIEIIDKAENDQGPINAEQILLRKNLEANLDAETVLGMSYPMIMSSMNTAGSPPFDPDAAIPANTNEPYLAWLQDTLGKDEIADVISSSYGENEQTVPRAYAYAVCNLFAQLGARGTTFLCSTGDDGVGKNGACFSNDARNASMFLPTFPASCPYVTAVGGTKNFEPEVAAYDEPNAYASGGGFSNYFDRPSYQNEVVPAYISSLGSNFSGLYNPTGRGYPDIAAQSQSMNVAWYGRIGQIDGTSAAAPVVAGILTLVNDALVTAGKPVLGFLNPCLYARLHKAFTDITSGSAAGCDSEGFPAKAGWDAVTGFGTPYFPRVKDAAINAEAGTSAGKGTYKYRW